MQLFAVLFGLGVLAVYQLSALPGWGSCAVVLGVAPVLLAVPRLRVFAGLPLGFAWALTYLLWTRPPIVPAAEIPTRLTLDGHVVSLVRQHGPISRFVFQVEGSADRGAEPMPWLVRLSWRAAPPLSPGDRLRLTARVKPAHGYASPGAWDYEGWLYRQGIRYRGYVLDAASVAPPGPACCAIDRLRARLSAQIDALAISAEARGILRALVVGDKSGLPVTTGEVFRATGTSHLMAISGLHVGLVAALGLVGFSAAWRRVPRLVDRVPARVAGAVCGLLAGALYALLAGFSLPTQRALIMLTVAAVAIVLRRDTRPASVLAVAVLCVLLRDPGSIVAAGFWLSFGAVAAILAVLALSPRSSVVQAALRVQLAISVVLWPIQSIFGLPVALIAPLVNLLLVPVFALLIVPASLAGVALLVLVPVAGEAWLVILAPLIDATVAVLDRLAAHAVDWRLPVMPGGPAVVAVLVAVLLALAPRGFPLRLLGLPLVAVAWMPHDNGLGQGDLHLHVLDTGQGLSVVVETAAHTLVYDTGPRYPSGFSTAEAVVEPFLHTRRHARIDRLVLSHGDNDHAGGARQLIQAFTVDDVVSGEPARTVVTASSCRRGDSWIWDGVEFAILHPIAGSTPSGNNASCVLRISGAGGSVLLTGDIEKSVERQLVADIGTQLRSDIVVVPHHGSRTSSDEAFVAAVRPRLAIYTAGWANRYGFPAATVDRRWQAIGAERLNTATTGTISLRIDARDGFAAPVCQRVHRRRFWQHAGGSADACHAVSSGRRAAPGHTESDADVARD